MKFIITINILFNVVIHHFIYNINYILYKYFAYPRCFKHVGLESVIGLQLGHYDAKHIGLEMKGLGSHYDFGQNNVDGLKKKKLHSSLDWTGLDEVNRTGGYLFF